MIQIEKGPVLTDWQKATATEQRNGSYFFEGLYTATGPFASHLKEGAKVVTNAGYRRKNQLFEIQKVVKLNHKTIEVYAEHVSMQTKRLALKPRVVINGNGLSALETWKSSLVGDHRFTVWSDIPGIKRTSWRYDKVQNARNALGGVEGSLLDVFGGEYEFDNYTIKLWQRRGKKSPTAILYGKNLTSLEQELAIDETYTSVYPYVTKEELIYTLDDFIVDSENVGKFAQRRIYPLDLSDKFREEDTVDLGKLREYAQQFIKNNRVGIPQVKMTVTYADLAKAGEGPLEEIDLCDTLPVVFEQMGVTESEAKVVETVWNCLTETYDKITLGSLTNSFKTMLTQDVMAKIDTVEKEAKESLSYFMANGVNKTYTGDTFPIAPVGGFKVGDWFIQNNGSGEQVSYVWTGNEWSKAFDKEAFDRKFQEVDNSLLELTEGFTRSDAKAEQALSKATDLETVTGQVQTQLEKAKNDLVSLSTNSQNLMDWKASTDPKLSKVVADAKTALDSLTGLDSRLDTVEPVLDELGRQMGTKLTQADLSGYVTTTQLTAKAGEISREISRVEGLVPTQIGGRNLIPGTADFSGTHWEKPDTWRLEGSLYKGAGILTWVSGNKGAPMANISVQSGDTYTFSAYIKKENAGTVYFYLYDTTETRFATANVPRETLIQNVGDNFQRFTITFRVTRPGLLRPRFAILSTDEGGFSVAGYQLESGTLATDWTPAPEDINSELSSTKTLITQTAEGQTQLSNRLTTTQDKVSTAETKINQLIGDVSSKVSQTDYNTLTGRVSSAETAITQNANEISQRLTRTEVESTITGKGYQTKAQVDDNITGRGYITNAGVNSKLQGYVTSTTYNNYVQETADAFQRTISQVERKIPAEIGGVNKLRDSDTMSGSGWFNSTTSRWRKSNELYRTLPIFEHVSGTKNTPQCNYDVQSGETYTFSCYVKKDSGGNIHLYLFDGTKILAEDREQTFLCVAGEWRRIVFSFTAISNGTIAIRLAASANQEGVFKHTPFKLESGSIATDWTPAPEDVESNVTTKLAEYKTTVDGQFASLSTQYAGKTEFAKVQTTVSLAEQIFGSTNKDGALTNIAREVLAKDIFQTEIKRLETNADLLARVGDGVSLTNDPDFANGMNGVLVYDNSTTGRVTITREQNADGTIGQPTNTTSSRLKITHTGTASPNLGGVKLNPLSTYYSPNKAIVVEISALLPVGYSLNLHSNGFGTGGYMQWLTSNQGTGKWERYVGLYQLGTGTINQYALTYISVSGPTPTATSPLIWYIQRFDIKDISNSGSQALSTRVTQLSDSYGVKVLNNRDKILSEIKLTDKLFYANVSTGLTYYPNLVAGTDYFPSVAGTNKRWSSVINGAYGQAGNHFFTNGIVTEWTGIEIQFSNASTEIQLRLTKPVKKVRVDLYKASLAPIGTSGSSIQFKLGNGAYTTLPPLTGKVDSIHADVPSVTTPSDVLTVKLTNVYWVLTTSTLMVSEAPSKQPWRDEKVRTEETTLLASAGEYLIKSDKVVLDADTIIRKAFINKLFVQEMEANFVKAFTGHFGNLVSESIDAKHLSADRAKFIQALFDGSDSVLTITGDKMTYTSKQMPLSVEFSSYGVSFISDGSKAGFLQTTAYQSNGQQLKGISWVAEKDRKLHLGYRGAESEAGFYNAIEIDGNTGATTVAVPLRAVTATSGLYLIPIRISDTNIATGICSEDGLSALTFESGQLYRYYRTSMSAQWNKTRLI